MKTLHGSSRFFSAFLGAFIFAAVIFPSAAGAFTLEAADGKIYRLADLKGKWVVVNFWATWCPPCIKEIPDLAAFAKAHNSDALVLGVALEYDDIAKVKAFAKKVGMTYPLVLGDKQAEGNFGAIKGLPTTLLYDPSGKQVFNKAGTVTRELLEDLLKQFK